MAFSFSPATPPPTAATPVAQVSNPYQYAATPGAPPLVTPVNPSATPKKTPSTAKAPPAQSEFPGVLNPPQDRMPAGAGTGEYGPGMILLNAFAAHKYATETKRTNAAIAEVAGQNATWDAVVNQVQQFRLAHPNANMGPDSTDPHVQALRHAVTSAYNDKVNAYAKYVMPDVAAAQADAETDPKAAHKLEQKHRKSIVNAVKAWAHGEFSPEMPELILQSQLNQMKAVKDPMALIPDPSGQQTLAYYQNQDSVDLARAKTQLSDLYGAAPGGDVGKLSPANQRRISDLQNQMSVLSTGKPVEKTTAQVEAENLQKIDQKISSGQPISADEWRAAGKTPPTPGKPITVGSASTGQYLVPIGEDGQPKMGANGQPVKYLIAKPVNTAAVDAASKARGTFDEMTREYQASHPGSTIQQARQAAWNKVAKGDDPAVAQDTQNALVGAAIENAIGNMSRGANPMMPQGGIPNFATIGADGLYHLNLAPVQPTTTSGWFGSNKKTTYPGQIESSGMPQVEAEFRSYLSDALKKEGLSPSEIAQVMGRPLYGATSPATTKNPTASSSKASPPPGAQSGITDSQVNAFMASPGGKGMTAAQARAALEAASNGGQ